MATRTQDPILFLQDGFVLKTITVTDSFTGAMTVYDDTAGGWQGGWSGSITPVGDTLSVSISTVPIILIGACTVSVVTEDYGGTVGGGSWSFTMDALVPPAVTYFEPSGVTTTLPRIAARIEDDYGLDTSTLQFSMSGVPIIVDGTFETDWHGSIIELQDGGSGPKEVLVTVTSWPEIPNGALVEFDLSIENIYGDTP